MRLNLISEQFRAQEESLTCGKVAYYQIDMKLNFYRVQFLRRYQIGISTETGIYEHGVVLIVNEENSRRSNVISYVEIKIVFKRTVNRR